MKTRPFNRRSIVFLFAIAVFFCSVQSLSFGQVELIISDPASLTEATLHNSTVTLTLRGAAFEDSVNTIRRNLSVSRVSYYADSGVSVDDVKRLSDTEISVRLAFSGDFDRDATLAFTVRNGGIKNYNGSNLTDRISVTSTVESLTATPASLTEATLHNSTVTLTLRGRTFEDSVNTIRYYSLSVSGVSGVNVDDVRRLSDTEVTVRLRFSGDFDRDDTLTFRIGSKGIKNYNGDLTDTISVTSTVESLTATPASLTEATLHNSTVTLTLQGRTFEDHIGTIRRYLSVSGISGVSVDDVSRHSDTEVTVRLEFSGDLDRDATLTFRVDDRSIKGYGGSDLTANIPVTTLTESLTATPASLTEATLNNSTVTLTLRGRTFENNIRPYVSVSGISGVSVDDIRRHSDTEVTVRLESNRDFNRDATLTFRVKAGGIKNYNRDLTANIPVTTLTESLTATPASLTEATLHNSTVTLTLRGRTFENNIRPYVSVSGISGVSVDDVGPLSDTEIRVRLEFNGDLDRDDTLTFRVRAGGIKNYNRDLTANIPVTTLTESLTASPTSLTEATLNNSTVTLTLRGRTFENNIRPYVSVSGISGVNVGNLRLLSSTEVEVPLNFNGDFDRDGTLTFRVRSGGIKNYNASDLTANIRVSATIETQTPLAPTPTPTPTPRPPAQTIETQTPVAPTPTPTPRPVEVENPPVDTRTPPVPIDPSQPAIYWVGRDGIQRANLDGSNVQTLMEVVDPFNLIQLTLDAAGGKMYWIHRDWETYDEILQCANLDGSNVETFVRTVPYSLFDLTLDVSGGKIYWISNQWNENWEPTGGKIQRANLNGSQVETLVKVNSAESLTLDASGGKMYWISDERNIQRANLDGSNVETLWAAKTGASDLALDVSRGKMYWRGGDRVDGGYVSNIRHANLDGSNVQTLVTEEDSFDITLDVVGGKMYWVERKHWSQPAKIQRANLDGSNIETLVATRDEYYPLNLTLDVSEGKMYWVEWGDSARGKIQRANLDGSNTEDLVTEDIVTDWGTENFALIPSQIIEVPSPKTVHVNAADRPPMYWIDTSAGTLHRLVDTEVENLVPNVRNATSLTLDVANDKLYWTEKTSDTTGRIRSANLDGTNVQLVMDLTSVPLDITFNPVDSKLYLTNSWGKVQRLNLDGSRFQSNLIIGLATPMNIAVDTANDKLYWTEKTSDTTGRIRSANLDGTNIQLVKDLTSVPLDMTLDAADSKLYLTNVSGQVQRINLDGSGFQPNFVPGLNTRTNIAVDTAGQQLYLTSSDGKISRRNLSGGGSEEVVTGLGHPGGLVFGGTTPAPQIAATPATTEPATTDRAEDVNGDGTVNDTDASLVSEAISNGSTDATYDVNGDGKVNFDDLKLVLDNRDRNPYDVNGDGTVDNTDVGIVVAATLSGNYQANLDINGDGKVDLTDVVLISQNVDTAGTAAAPGLRTRLSAVQVDRIQAQIDLLLAMNDRSPGALYALQYLQSLIASARPDKTQLLANYPNPFNPETWIPYALVTDTNVKITIYNTQGIVIRTLQLGQQSAGYYTNRERAAYWDGRNTQGELVASGIYFYTLTAGDFTATQKMLIRK